uniref:Zinc finger, CCHC-type n=1 Tax=Tanacetum cinerariifolium TaxID=118510 RepID=A0A699H5Y2_TANCI|nr:zinc finger, CCHC-type [Tanacetum cinerariifolium]
MALDFAKLDRFEGVVFRRWHKKMYFLLSSMSVVYVMTTPIPEYGGDDATIDQIRKRAKWENDDYVRIGLILNGMSDPLFDIYQNIESFKELYDTFEAKYMAEDASSKKFLVSNFTNYKMTDSRPVLEQYNKFLGTLGRFQAHLEHKKEDLTLVELGSHLHIEEFLRIFVQEKMSRDVLTVGSTMRIPSLYRGEYSQWSKRFMNYLEEQTDGKEMINCIKYGNQPLPRVTQVSIAGTSSTEQPPLKDKSMWSDQEKKIQKIDHLARSLLIQGLLNDIYSLIDNRKAAVLYEYETFKVTEGELLLDAYIRYLQKKTVVVTSDPLALIAEKTKVSKRKGKVVVSSDSEGSDADDFSELKKITALLAKAFNRRKFYSKPTNNNLRTSSTFQSANKKQEYVKLDDKKVEKKDDEKKRDMRKVKCYNCKKEGHFAKDCKTAKVKDYEYYKTKMLLAKKDKDKQVLLVEDHAWVESSSDSDQEINANMVFMAQIKKVFSDSEASSSSADDKISEVSYYLSKSESEYEYETSEYYDNTTTYGLFVNDNDDKEIFHDCENFLENLIESQINHNESVVDHNDSEEIDKKQIADQEVFYDKMSVQLVELDKHVRDLKNTVLEKDFKIYELEECVHNKDREIEKCLERLNVCENKLHKMGQTNQTTHKIMPSKDKMYNGRKGIGFANPSYFSKAKYLRPTLYDERVINLGYTLMFLTHSDEALEIEKFKRAREHKIEFAYNYGNLNASYVNEKINFSDDYFQEIINPDFKKIDSSFQKTSSLKPEKVVSETENKSKNNCQVIEKVFDIEEIPNVIAPGMFKLSVSQSVSPISVTKTSRASNGVENLDTLSSVRRPKPSGVMNAYNNAQNAYCNLYDDDVNNLFVFDDVSIRKSHVSKMPFRKKPSASLNVPSKSKLNKYLPRIMRKWFPKLQPLAEPVAKWIPKIVQICLWIIDSGCSKHMTGNRDLLTNFLEKFLGTVRFGNNDFAVIAAYGDVVIGSMSIMKSTCFFRTEYGVDLLTGDCSLNLYTVALNEVASNSLATLLAKASSSQSWLWHQRLSHSNFATINNLVKNNLVPGLPKTKFEKDHLCFACEQGKIHRKHHKSKMTFASNKPLYILHMDLCGPMRIESINGKRYVLVVVADYSRYTCVFFLHFKDEALDLIISFIKKTQVNL